MSRATVWFVWRCHCPNKSKAAAEVLAESTSFFETQTRCVMCDLQTQVLLRGADKITSTIGECLGQDE